MTYTLDRFPTKEDQVVLDAAEGLERLSDMVSKLDRVIEAALKSRTKKKEAEKAMLRVIEAARSLEAAGTVDEGLDIAGRVLGKVLEFVGRKIITAIVRPILQFSARVAMNLIRMTVQATMRFVLVPALEAVAAAAGFLFTTPVGWAILAGIGAGALLYYSWDSIKEAIGIKPKVVEVEAAQPTGAVVGEAAPEVVAPPQPVEQPRTAVDRVLEPVRQAAAAVEEAVRGPTIVRERPQRQGRFTGFGGDMDGYIHETAQRYPILPERELRGFIRMENGWTGMMSPTGAIGTGQFTAGTWNRLIGRGGAALGMERITGIFEGGGRPRIAPNAHGNFRTEQDPRFDRRVNTLATGLLASQNAEMLRRAGLPINGQNLYFLHNVGPGIIPVLQGRPASAAVQRAIHDQGGVFRDATPEFYVREMGRRYQQAELEANPNTEVVGDNATLTPGTTVEPRQRTGRAVPTRSPALAANDTRPQGDLIRGPGNSIVRTQ